MQGQKKAAAEQEGSQRSMLQFAADIERQVIA